MKRTALKRKTPLRSRTRLTARRPLQGAVVPQVRRKPRKAPTLSTLKKKLWILCREITRQTYGNTCYTCGRTGLEGGNWQTGHFLSSSVCSVALRYDLKNLRPQCYNCNINKSGNWPAFEERLNADNGTQFTEQLKATNRATTGLQYDSLYYQRKIEEYTTLLSDMQKGGSRS